MMVETSAGQVGWELEILAHRVLDPDPTVHEGFPRLVRAADGRLLLFSRRGTTHAADPARIVLRTSFDDGANWTPPREIWRDPAGWCAHNPVAAIAPDGSVILWCSRYDWERRAKRPCVWSRSADYGETWLPFEHFDSSPYRSTYYITDTVRVGDRLLAASTAFSAGAVEPCWVELWRSDDGARWSHLGPVTPPAANLGDEVALAHLGGDELLLLLRGRHRPGLFRYRSRNGGLSWSAEEDLGDQVGTIQRPFLTPLGGRRWLLTGRQVATPRSVVAYLSEDDGETFGHRRDLLAYRSDGGYTSVVPRGDGSLLLVTYADPDEADRPDLHLFELRWRGLDG